MKIKLVKIITMVKSAAIISSVFILIGCASMNSEFDCPNKPGVTCHSLDQVNNMIDKGMLGKDGISNKFGATQACSTCLSPSHVINSKYQSYPNEAVVRVWIAPYQDINGNYHEESVIRAAISKDATSAPKEIVEVK